MSPEYKVHIVDKSTGKTNRVEEVDAPTIEDCLDISTEQWNTDEEWVVRVDLDGEPQAVMQQPD